MVIHWNMTYNRHCRGIHSALSMVSLLWWLLQPVATPRGCWGPASDQPSLGFSSPCCLSRGQQLSQLSLTQKYFQASKLPLAICCHTFVSAAARTFRDELDWGEPENKMSASLASEQMAHGGAVPDTSIFFLPPEVLRLLSYPPGQEEKNWLSDNSHWSLVTTGRAVTPGMPPIRQEVMLVSRSQHQITDCDTCSGCPMEQAVDGDFVNIDAKWYFETFGKS